jgi:hypothetical protein
MTQLLSTGVRKTEKEGDLKKVKDFGSLRIIIILRKQFAVKFNTKNLSGASQKKKSSKWKNLFYSKALRYNQVNT